MLNNPAQDVLSNDGRSRQRQNTSGLRTQRQAKVKVKLISNKQKHDDLKRFFSNQQSPRSPQNDDGKSQKQPTFKTVQSIHEQRKAKGYHMRRPSTSKPTSVSRPNPREQSAGVPASRGKTPRNPVTSKLQDQPKAGTNMERFKTISQQALQLNEKMLKVQGALDAMDKNGAKKAVENNYMRTVPTEPDFRGKQRPKPVLVRHNDFDSSSVANTKINDYLQQQRHPTPGMRDKIVSYKYPKTLHSRYIEAYSDPIRTSQTIMKRKNYNDDQNLRDKQQIVNDYFNNQGPNQPMSSRNTKSIETFNYDDIRRQIKMQREVAQYGPPDEVQHQVRKHKADGIQHSYDTAHRDFFKYQNSRRGYPTVKPESNRKLIELKNNLVAVPMNCFISNTSYKNSYVAADNIQRLQQIKPFDVMLKQKFRAESAYKQNYHSPHSGQGLQNHIDEQRARMHEIGSNQRKGTVNFRSQKLKFKGESASKISQERTKKSQERDGYKKTKAFKPFDSLCCPGKTIKFSDVTQNKRDYVLYKNYSPPKQGMQY